MTTLQQRFEQQHFDNEYALVDGVIKNKENPEHFKIPAQVIKRHIKVGHFVEVRIDSSRFSMHDDAAAQCTCPSCNGELTKPILRHEQPASFVKIPLQKIPARGWGEDFWVRVSGRDEDFLTGVVDNELVESRLHGLTHGSEICFHEAHILGVHPVHRQDLVSGMNADDLRELAQWLRE